MQIIPKTFQFRNSTEFNCHKHTVPSHNLFYFDIFLLKACGNKYELKCFKNYLKCSIYLWQQTECHTRNESIISNCSHINFFDLFTKFNALKPVINDCLYNTVLKHLNFEVLRKRENNLKQLEFEI